MTHPGILVRLQGGVSCAGTKKGCDRRVCRWIAQPCAFRYGFQRRTAILSSHDLDAKTKERKTKLNARPKGERMETRQREQVDLKLIDDNPWQPRQSYDEEALQELADSIHSLGLLQVPLGRRAEDGRVQSAFGHRRVRACRLNLEQGRSHGYIDMDIAEITDDDMAVLALTENEARKQLTQVEVVRAHKKAIAETSLTVQALADKLGLNRSTLSNNLRVLELPDFVLEHVESGNLSIHVAREFLVMQNDDHAHTQEMRQVVDEIAKTWGFRGAPDWSRRHVRKLIFERVAVNEADFRPLGPRGKMGYSGYHAGSHREAGFDVEAFSAERPGKLHTIPNPSDDDDKYESSRVWTCDAKAWRSAQSRATRESNKEAVATGQPATTSTSSKAPSRDQKFEEALSQDPVWKAIAAARETPGRARPATDEEREALGTRAELKVFSTYGGYGTFHKILQITDAENFHSWNRDGGQLPPWFPDLKECQRTCTVGATYVMSSENYGGPSKPILACFNKEHYLEKLERGLAEYKAKVEEQRTGMDRQDQKAMQKLQAMLRELPLAASSAMASALLTASGRELALQHPLGVYHRDFSYEGAPKATVREIVDRWATAGTIPEGESRELVAALATHYLRAAGDIEALLQASTETAEAVDQPGDDVAPSPKGRLATWLDEQEYLDGRTATQVLEKARESLGDDITASALGQSVHESTRWQKVKTTNRAAGQVGVMFFRPRLVAEAVSQGNAA